MEKEMPIMKHISSLRKPIFFDLLVITGVFSLASFILYGYYSFFTKGGMETIFRNWDGPGYLIVAKSLYNVDIINKVNPFPYLYPSYFAYLFPLYPLFIRLFSFIGYGESMIFVSLLFSLLFIFALYFLIRTVNPKANALVVSLLSVFYMPRWFIVSHVGNSETLLLFFITMFLLFLVKKQYFLSAIFLSCAQLTKSQGMVFFVGLFCSYLFQIFIVRKKSILAGVKEFLPFLLVPLSLAGLFAVYDRIFGDFFIYLGIIRLNNIMQWPLLKILTAETINNISTPFFSVWKESFIFNYLLYFVSIMLLFQKKFIVLGIIALVYFIPVLTLFHMDVARYMTPLMPFLLLAYSDALSEKPVYTALFLGIPAVYLYAVGFINYDVAECLPSL